MSNGRYSVSWRKADNKKNTYSWKGMWYISFIHLADYGQKELEKTGDSAPPKSRGLTSSQIV